MANSSIFFRILASPVESKGTDLLQQITLHNQGDQPDKTFPVDPESFGSIPGSPFAYWVEDNISELFQKLPRFLSEGRDARIGLSTRSDNRFLRLFWEVLENSVGKVWFPFAKGGSYSPYFYDVHLIVDWENDGERVKTFISQNDIHSLEAGDWSRWVRSRDKYFRPGITWPRRTQKGLNLRALPVGCIFADKGPVAFAPDDNIKYLLALLSLTNSFPFKELVRLQMVFGSFEVGVIQQTPIPNLSNEEKEELATLALKCYDLARIPSTFDETTHVFRLPALTAIPGVTLAERIQALTEQETARQAHMQELQAKIDSRVAELYGIGDEGQRTGDGGRRTEDEGRRTGNEVVGEGQVEDTQPASEDDEAEDSSPVLRPSSLISSLLQWCLGAAFGRWDARFALQPDQLPALGGPFDPLPRYSPGRLTETSPSSVHGLSSFVSPDGILVDDPTHQRDIVTSVRRVLQFIWQERADDIEQEACQILEVPDLRAYFRDPRLFFHYHIKRYSKSRRKAPIYWMLQSAKKDYAVWLYYPRLNPDLLFHAGREYVDAKIFLESERLKEIQPARTGLTGVPLKTLERQIARQADLVEEIKTFGKELDRVALLEIKPDFNDGVLLNLAPLYKLTPWKEAEKTWNELASGKYEWSSMGKKMGEKRRGTKD